MGCPLGHGATPRSNSPSGAAVAVAERFRREAPPFVVGAQAGCHRLGREAHRLVHGACVRGQRFAHAISAEQPIEVAAVGSVRVVPVDAVLHEQFVVGLDAVRMRATHHLHTARRLICNQVDEILGARQIILEGNLVVGVEVDEDEVAVGGCSAGRLPKPEVAAVESLAVGTLAREAAQLALGRIAPTVVDAAVHPSVASRLAADHRAPVAARVQKHADLFVPATADDDRSPADPPGHKVSRCAHLGLVAGVKPAAVENPLVLGG